MSLSAKSEHKIAILSLSFTALLTIFSSALNDNYRAIHSEIKTLVYDENRSAYVKCKEVEKLQYTLNDMRIIGDAISILEHKHTFIVENHLTINKQPYTNRAIQNMEHKLKYLTFGYINQTIEDLNIPYYLKMLCLQFYGNIIMNSKILNLNQTNIIAYSLNSIVTNAKFFAPKLIYDSKNSGFNSNLFDSKCANCVESLVIIKTNSKDIFCMFKRPRNSYGFLLHASFSSPPILHTIKSRIYLYQFPNDFRLNPSEKFADIFTKFNDDIRVVNRIGFMQKDKINVNLCIDQFEVFEL